jgi:predicted DNA-binding protein
MAPTQMRVTTIRFGRTAWERIQAAAHNEGVSASQYVREAALMRAFLQDYRRGEQSAVTAKDVAQEILRISRETS